GRQWPRSTAKWLSAFSNLLCGSWQIPDADGFAKLFKGEKVGSQRLAVAKFCGAIAALGVQEIEQGNAAPVVGVVGDVAGLLRDVPVLVPVQQNHSVVGFQATVRVF